ncbi:hypothetical protein JI58_08205 [Marinosulfonomonas sp. PRT-SC04]|nr:hypothetical protein JI58_08205 [Marinosulfonomonas sp. PRT-SC04]
MVKTHRIQNEGRFIRSWLNPEFTTKAIADDFYVSETCVRQTAARLNLPTAAATGRRSGNKLSPDKIEAAKQQWQQGVAVADIAASVNMGTKSIYTWAARFNWPNCKNRRQPAIKKIATAALVGSAAPASNTQKQSVDVLDGPRMPSAAVLVASFTLRRLGADQIVLLAESGGRYQALIDLAETWGKGRVFLQQCWNEYYAGVAL